MISQKCCLLSVQYIFRGNPCDLDKISLDKKDKLVWAALRSVLAEHIGYTLQQSLIIISWEREREREIEFEIERERDRERMRERK